MEFLFLAFAALCSACPISAQAELYYYKDQRGVWHFTNVPDDARYQNISRLKIEKPRKKAVSAGFNDFREFIEHSAKKYQVDPLLIRALIKVESSYDPYAVSDSGAQGLMQLMPGTALWMEVSDPFNPEDNIEGGVKYFRRLLSIFNNQLIPSIAAYHAGENSVIRNNYQIPPIEATQRYVRKVITQYYLYHGIKESSPKTNKIYRIESPEGDVIFTNHPALYQAAYKEIAYQ
ncbi:MAG: transglycosylase SLT domain-containing protein [Nitrospiria bacterium]